MAPCTPRTLRPSARLTCGRRRTGGIARRPAVERVAWCDVRGDEGTARTVRLDTEQPRRTGWQRAWWQKEADGWKLGRRTGNRSGGRATDVRVCEEGDLQSVRSRLTRDARLVTRGGLEVIGITIYAPGLAWGGDGALGWTSRPWPRTCVRVMSLAWPLLWHDPICTALEETGDAASMPPDNDSVQAHKKTIEQQPAFAPYTFPHTHKHRHRHEHPSLRPCCIALLRNLCMCPAPCCSGTSPPRKAGTRFSARCR